MKQTKCRQCGNVGVPPNVCTCEDGRVDFEMTLDQFLDLRLCSFVTPDMLIASKDFQQALNWEYLGETMGFRPETVRVKFGDPVCCFSAVPVDQKNSEAEQKLIKFKTELVKMRGHYHRPGTGPNGKYCRDCVYVERMIRSKTYIKCGRARNIWTSGPGTDIRLKDPACIGFEERVEK